MKTCPKCGESKLPEEFHKNKNLPDGLACWCKGCVRESAAAWYRKNRDSVLQRSKQYVADNREEVRARSAAWYQSNLDRERGKRRKYREDNLDKERARLREHYAKNPGQYLEKWRVRRARLLGATGEAPVSEEFLSRLHADYTTRGCSWCGGTEETPHVDHIVPLVRGGLHVEDNLQILCGTCNRSKGSRTMDEWIAYLKERSGRV